MTKKDIDQLKKVFPTRDEFENLRDIFATKQELQEFRVEFRHHADSVARAIEDLKMSIDSIRDEGRQFRDALLTHMDKYMKTTEDYRQEHLMLVAQVDRHEDWIHKINKKTGVNLT